MRVDPANVQSLRELFMLRAEHHDAESAACAAQAAASRARARALHALAETLERTRPLAPPTFLAILEHEGKTVAHEAIVCEQEALRHDAESSRAASQAASARSEAATIIAAK